MKRAFYCWIILFGFSACAAGCSRTGGGGRVRTVAIEATAYCWCGECNGYDWGHDRYFHVDFWNRVVNYGSREGQAYTGATASGARLKSARPGLFSGDSLRRPWMIPLRIAFPWTIFPRDGTIAADTDYYPFGTRMKVPGYGWGVVQDVGGAIKGPRRIDLYFPSHGKANQWGRQQVEVRVERPR